MNHLDLLSPTEAERLAERRLSVADVLADLTLLVDACGGAGTASQLLKCSKVNVTNTLTRCIPIGPSIADGLYGPAPSNELRACDNFGRRIVRPEGDAWTALLERVSTPRKQPRAWSPPLATHAAALVAAAERPAAAPTFTIVDSGPQDAAAAEPVEAAGLLANDAADVDGAAAPELPAAEPAEPAQSATLDDALEPARAVIVQTIQSLRDTASQHYADASALMERAEAARVKADRLGEALTVLAA